MEVKLICVNCQREMLHDVEKFGDNVNLEVYPCGHCKKERERREEDEKSDTTE